VQQRASFWNRPCDQADSLLAYGFPADQRDIFLPTTGEEELNVDPNLSPAFGQQNFCYIRERRTFRPVCPAGLSCTAGGECNASAEAPGLEFITAAPPPPPPLAPNTQ
jgi:hypothetical protein